MKIKENKEKTELNRLKKYLEDIHGVLVDDDPVTSAIKLIDDLCAYVDILNHGNNEKANYFNDFYYGTEEGDIKNKAAKKFKKNLKLNGFYDQKLTI